jgi:Zc3h12a-like ribonuclease protein
MMKHDESSGRRLVIVDAANVAHSAPSARPRLSFLERLLERLAGEGLDVLVVADAGLERRIDDPDGYRRMVDSGLIRTAPPGTQADPLILSLARELDAWIVSNDRFRQWQDPSANGRRIGFRVGDDGVELRWPR